jgi:chemotaxis protein MotA
MKKGIALIVDGHDLQRFQEIMEIDIDSAEEHAMSSAEVFEAAGGFAPTIGIIGAVLGLIHVMENLSDPSKLGAGIAVAFVATIYGLVTANIICIPFGTKLKGLVKKERRLQEMILEGLLAMINGEHPLLIRRRMDAFLDEPSGDGKKK